MTWTIRSDTDLNRLVKTGSTTESLHLDFKSSLDRGPGAQAELGRDVAQFANTDGGCLLLGVHERKDPTTNVKTAIQIVGVKDPDKDREDIEAWIRNVLVPGDLTRTIDFVRVGQVVLLAVNIPPSRRLIWVNDPGQPNKLEVVRRTNHGKEYMRPNEIERHWSNTPRAAQIAFHEAFAEASLIRSTAKAIEMEFVGGILRVGKHVGLHGFIELPLDRPCTIGAHNGKAIDVRVPIGAHNRSLRVPFELLSTAWCDSHGTVHLLCLAPLVYEDGSGRLRFDPFRVIADQTRT